MKKIILLTVLFCWQTFVYAQQWIDKAYQYDSILNITYGTSTNFVGGTDTLKMDVYLPICNDTFGVSRRPLLMLIHGGAFLAGNRYDANINAMVKDFAKRGYVTATIEYRLGFINDEATWQCNFPNYSCVFATDSAEWYRAQYRAMQDAKGALRYLINRHQQYRIDTNNVFVAGESAGAITALGVAFMDTTIEKYAEAGAIPDANAPNTLANTCLFNVGKTFGATIPRPDLGGVDGSIEPTNIKYKIKGVGNLFGAVLSDVFQNKKTNTTSPAIYLFHQPCDIVVSDGSAKIYAGLSWCLANCYSCYGIANTPMCHGSTTINNWNTANSYGLNIMNDITSTANPYNCLFGTGSCADQINNPCHALDNYTLRTTHMATFFAGLINTSPICIPNFIGPNIVSNNIVKPNLEISPNPFHQQLHVQNNADFIYEYVITDITGKTIQTGKVFHGHNVLRFADNLQSTIYYMHCTSKSDSYSIVLRAE